MREIYPANPLELLFKHNLVQQEIPEDCIVNNAGEENREDDQVDLPFKDWIVDPKGKLA